MATDLDTVTAIARALSNELNEAQEELEAATVRAVQAENDHKRDYGALQSVVDLFALDIATLLAAMPQCAHCQRPATKRWQSGIFASRRCDEHAASDNYQELPHAAVVRRHAGGE